MVLFASGRPPSPQWLAKVFISPGLGSGKIFEDSKFVLDLVNQIVLNKSTLYAVSSIITTYGEVHDMSLPKNGNLLD